MLSGKIIRPFIKGLMYVPERLEMEGDRTVAACLHGVIRKY